MLVLEVVTQSIGARVDQGQRDRSREHELLQPSLSLNNDKSGQKVDGKPLRVGQSWVQECFQWLRHLEVSDHCADL
jgi:hypothetical protein